MTNAVLQPKADLSREREGGIPNAGILPLAKSTTLKQDSVLNSHAHMETPIVVWVPKRWVGWELPGHGKSYFDCGRWRLKGCLNVDAHVQDGILEPMVGKVFVKLYRRSCLRAECPICYEKWAGKEASKIEWRLKAWSGAGEPIHVIVSPAMKDVHHLAFTSLRQKCYDVARVSGFLGGSCIFHPFRQKSRSKAWYFSPHFHLIGFGWIRGTKRGYQKHGWVVKNAGVRRTVSGTALYQLSHCGIHQKLHSVTWFGKLSYNRLKVPEKPIEREVCPICGSKLRDMYYFGSEALPEAEGCYWFDYSPSFQYKPKYGDYG
jgi:hypothetical protein